MLRGLKSRIGAVAAWVEARPWWIVVLGFIVGLPATVLSVAPYFPEFEKTLKDSPILTLSLSVGWSLAVMAVSAAAHACKPPPSGSVFELLHLLECLKQIVGEKVNRFEAFLARHAVPDPVSTFDEITQPERQMASIVAAVYSYFEGILSKEDREKVKLRVALARMGERHISEWESYYPSHHKPRSEISALQRDTSAFSRAKAGGKITIVEDIRKEAARRVHKRKFEVTDESRRDEEGSIICYPVKLKGTRQVPFVLSVCSSRTGFFRQDQEEVYRSILENFEQRIVLEYCLQEIKRKSNTVRNNTVKQHETPSTGPAL